jgi:hypothetical protein
MVLQKPTRISHCESRDVDGINTSERKGRGNAVARDNSRDTVRILLAAQHVNERSMLMNANKTITIA